MIYVVQKWDPPEALGSSLSSIITGGVGGDVSSSDLLPPAPIVSDSQMSSN